MHRVAGLHKLWMLTLFSNEGSGVRRSEWLAVI